MRHWMNYRSYLKEVAFFLVEKKSLATVTLSQVILIDYGIRQICVKEKTIVLN